MADQPVTRPVILSLIVSLLLASAPLMAVLPYFIVAVSGFCIVWRLFLLRGNSHNVSGLVKALLLLVAVISIIIEYRSLLKLEACASMLVLACIFKLLELRTTRDCWVILICCFFVVVIGLLFSQSMLMAGYVVLTLVILVSAMVGLNVDYKRNSLISVLNQGFIISVQALPLMLILFLLVPRIPPLWSIPVPAREGVIGLADSMSPGDIARLSQSDELVFRATFEDRVPPPEQRYWRSIIMSHFDGRTWSQQPHKTIVKNAGITMDEMVRWFPATFWFNKNRSEEPVYRYDIIQEPGRQPWLFSLGAAYEPLRGAGVTRDYRLVAMESVALRRRYTQDYRWYPSALADLPEWMARLSLQLPEQGDTKSRALAGELARQYQYDPVKIADHLLALFQNENFYYTLKPALLGNDSIDDFLFKRRQGFCSHYAGAFVFVMRAAGIPARVVAGYQGGEFKPEQKVIQVRQFDAHAWAEIWVPEQGWVRVDPTAAVAPERISLGLEEAVADEGTFLQDSPFSSIHFRHISWLNTVRLSWEQLEYQWQRYVLGYHQESQDSLFKRLFGNGKWDIYQVLTVLLVIVTLLFVLVMSFLLLRASEGKRSDIDKLYSRFCRKMAKKGVARNPSEAPLTYGKRIAHLIPELAEKALGITSEYEYLKYGLVHKSDQKLRKKELSLLLKQL